MVSVFDVFTPNDQPIFTYVDRSSLKLEAKLKDVFQVKNSVVSISGPSKTGKTVLLKAVVDDELLIPVSGAAIRSADDLWRGVLSWMEVSEKETVTETSGVEYGGTASGGGSLKIPLVAEGQVSVQASGARREERSVSSSTIQQPFMQITREIGGSEFIVFIDDFHYIPRESQAEIAKQIKALAESGVKICTASVPHRAEDVVRANTELRGRLAIVDIAYWTIEELGQIADKGFGKMNIVVSQSDVKKLTGESFGSPQLMQALCQNLCIALGIREALPERTEVSVSHEKLREALEQTTQLASFSKLLGGLHSGPKVRGAERKQFSFRDGSEGDVYRAILLAISSGDPELTFRYDDLLDRVKSTCLGEAPSGSSISTSLSSIQKIADEMHTGSSILEWDEDVLNIVDPYFAFFLRNSSILRNLGKAQR